MVVKHVLRSEKNGARKNIRSVYIIKKNLEYGIKKKLKLGVNFGKI